MRPSRAGSRGSAAAILAPRVGLRLRSDPSRRGRSHACDVSQTRDQLPSGDHDTIRRRGAPLSRMTQGSAPASLDDVRRYWDERPCNIRHSPKPVGSREYFDEVEARKYFVEPHIPAFADFGRWRGKRVLEVGCGIGTDSINFARAGAELTAVDLSGESLGVAAQRAEVMGVADRIRFVRGERRGARRRFSRRAVRPRLLVRRRPPHAAVRNERSPRCASSPRRVGRSS